MQFNIRLPKDLVKDMEYIAKNLKISRNDWLKVKLAELISREIESEKFDIYEQAEDKFVRGVITEQDFMQRKGIKPTKEMLKRRAESIKRQKILQKNSKLYSKNYFDEAKKEIKKKN